MRVIDWNISYTGNTEEKIKYLQTHLTKDSCIILQEVKPCAYEYIKTAIGSQYEMIYSLNFRKPSAFDSDARRLGVLILVNKGMEIEEAGVIERSLFPDRTVYATVRRNNQTIKILGLHSLTGCGYYRSKSVQYDSLTEFIDRYRPDIIGIDANEPQIDHYDIHKMKFFDNGLGAKNFFNKVVDIGLNDAFIQCNGSEGFELGSPIATSHTVKRKGAVRYDFLFAKNKHIVHKCSYNYDDAVKAGSDHAIILADVMIKTPEI